MKKKRPSDNVSDKTQCRKDDLLPILKELKLEKCVFHDRVIFNG